MPPSELFVFTQCVISRGRVLRVRIFEIFERFSAYTAVCGRQRTATRGATCCRQRKRGARAGRRWCNRRRREWRWPKNKRRAPTVEIPNGGLRGTSETESSMTCARATFSGRAKNLRFPVDQLPRSPPPHPHSRGKSGGGRVAVVVRGRRRGPAVNARPTDYYYTTATRYQYHLAITASNGCAWVCGGGEWSRATGYHWRRNARRRRRRSLTGCLAHCNRPWTFF